MIAAALAGRLDDVSYRKDPVFSLDVPAMCPGVPEGVLDPRGTWSSPQAYDEQAGKLAHLFVENFKIFEKDVARPVKEAGPRVQPSISN